MLLLEKFLNCVKIKYIEKRRLYMVIRKKDTNYPSIDKTHEKQYNYFDNKGD